jgi:hypothetical protein
MNNIINNRIYFTFKITLLLGNWMIIISPKNRKQRKVKDEGSIQQIFLDSLSFFYYFSTLPSWVYFLRVVCLRITNLPLKRMPKERDMNIREIWIENRKLKK